MTTSEVTVLTASYNPGHYFKECIESLQNQTYTNWKHIIVDDASTDDSLSLIKEHLNDSRVTLIRNDNNIGQSKSQNRGLLKIETPFTLMLDSDDLLVSDTIEILLAESRKVTEEVALICGNKEVFYHFGGKILGRYVDRNEFYHENRYQFLLENYVPYPRFYRTSALKDVGGWPTDDPYEGRYLEDRRMDVKLIEKYTIHWIDRLLYRYRKHEDTLSTRFDVINEMIEWNVREALKSWGDVYEPQFGMENGYKVLEKLMEKGAEL